MAPEGSGRRGQRRALAALYLSLACPVSHTGVAEAFTLAPSTATSHAHAHTQGGLMRRNNRGVARPRPPDAPVVHSRRRELPTAAAYASDNAQDHSPPPPPARRKRDFRGSLEASREMQDAILKATTPGATLALVLRNPARCNHVNVCTALFRVSKLAEGRQLAPSEESQLQQLLEVAEGLLAERRFTARHLSNLAVALARLGDTACSLLPRVAEAFTAKARSATVGEMSMILWAYATLQRHELELFDAAVLALAPRVSELATKEICTAAWALSAMNHYDKHLMEGMAAEFAKRALRAIQGDTPPPPPQDLTMLAWAFAHMSDSHWTLQQCSVELLQQSVEPLVLRTLARHRPADVAQLATAMAKLGYDSPALMEGLCVAALRQLGRFAPRELNALLLALAKLDFKEPLLLEALTRELARNVDARRFTRQELVNVAWSMAVLDVEEAPLLSAVLRALQDMGPFQDRELHQLHQVHLVFGERLPAAFSGVRGRLLEQADAAWRAEKRRVKASSARHLDVSKCLSLMGIEHRNESEHDIDIEVVGVGLRLIDAPATTAAGDAGADVGGAGAAEHSSAAAQQPREEHVPLRVAVEVDGPGHFTCNTRRSLGHTVLKHRILQQMGWTVVQVPFYHWDRIPFWASMERKRYLQRKLGITRTIFFGERDWSTYAPIGSGHKSTRFD